MEPFALPTFPLSLAAAGMRAPEGTPADIRWVMAYARRAGYRALHFNAAAPEIRPRDLSRSARRDLAAHARRAELASSGVDLWIPKSHFTDPAYADRAASALLDAVGLAADLAELTDGKRLLSTALPAQGADQIKDALAAHAMDIGVIVADHTYPWPDDLDGIGPVQIGIDPAAVILAGDSPPKAVSMASAAAALASVRLCDLAASGRVVAGEGSLDELAFRVAVATANYDGPLIVDIRNLPPGEEPGGQLHTVRLLYEAYAHPDQQ